MISVITKFLKKYSLYFVKNAILNSVMISTKFLLLYYSAYCIIIAAKLLYLLTYLY